MVPMMVRLAGPVAGCGGGMASAEGVTGEVDGGVAEPTHVAFDHDGDALRGEPIEEPAVAVDAPKAAPHREPGGSDPSPVGPDGAGGRAGAVDNLDSPAAGFGVGLGPP